MKKIAAVIELNNSEYKMVEVVWRIQYLVVLNSGPMSGLHPTASFDYEGKLLRKRVESQLRRAEE